jgi:hypothetical protein
MNVVVLRSELGYQANDIATVSFGYDWFRVFNSDSDYIAWAVSTKPRKST